jgi:hypothetical protein
MFCPKCGKEQLGEVRYCGSCGAELALPGSSPAVMASTKSATGFVIASVICAAISLLFVPPLFGVGGIMLGYFAFRRNRTAGIVCMAISGVCMVVGVILGVWLWLFL